MIRHAIQSHVKGHPNIKNMIAIASGKGGVGKSTTAVNLALGLHQQGIKAGISDADIYGPSQGHLLGQHEEPEIRDKRIQPPINHGIPSMSIAYLVDPNSALIWRGPMVSKALQQLLYDTDWPELDVLIIDLPPGTGDVQLTLVQKIPLTAAVIVTTPQDLSLIDAKRAMAMFDKVSIPTLGLIENMSGYICPNCGHHDAIFAEHGADHLANDTAPVLGHIPLHGQIRRDADQGTPTVIANTEQTLSQTYGDIATCLLKQLSQLPKDYSAVFPNIKVE